MADISPQWIAIAVTLWIAISSSISSRRSQRRSEQALANEQATRVAAWVDSTDPDPVLRILNSSALPVYNLSLWFAVSRNGGPLRLQVARLDPGHDPSPAPEFRLPVVNPSAKAAEYRVDFTGAFVASFETVAIEGLFHDARGEFWQISRGLVKLGARRPPQQRNDDWDAWAEGRSMRSDLLGLRLSANRSWHRLIDYVTGRPPGVSYRDYRRVLRQGRRTKPPGS